MVKKIFLVILSSFFLINVESAQAATWQHITSGSSQLPKPFPVAPSPPNQQTASIVFDVDNDGDQDFVIAERRSEPSVVLYRYDKPNNKWITHTIDSSKINIEASGAYTDIDGDGDLDIVFGGDNSNNQIWWWENPYNSSRADGGFSTTWTRRYIKNEGGNKHHDMTFGDFDGDGKQEFAFWNQNASPNGTLFFAEIPANPKSISKWNYLPIFSTGDKSAEGLVAVDIDGDNTLDLAGAGYWFKNISGNNFKAEKIVNNRLFTRSAAGQLIPGGYAEVVIGPGDDNGKLAMYYFENGSWKEKQIENNVIHGHSLQVADIDRNGTQDIFNAEMRLNSSNTNAKTNIYYNDGSGNFTKDTISSGIGNHESRLGDLNGDGYLDILGKPYNWDTPRVDVWFQNGNSNNATPTPSSGTNTISLDNWKRYVIDSNKPWRTVVIDSAKIDDDNYPDIVTGGWWYKNPGSAGGNWGSRKTIGDPLKNMAVLYDVDGKSGVDVIGTKGGSNPTTNPNSSEMVWAQNDGNGNFTIRQNIPNGKGDFIQGAVAGNINGKQVALSWHQNGGGVQLLTIPNDPVNQTWTRTYASSTTQDEDLSLGNIDNSGGNDLLLGNKWLKNSGSVWVNQILYDTSDHPDRNELADINGDGKLDAVVGYEAINVAGKLAWYEQPEKVGGKWTEHIISLEVVGPMSMDAGDMDNDGDIDVVVGEHNYKNPATAKLFVFENTNKGTSWKKHLVYTGDEHHDGAQLVDIDNDNDLDIISIGWQNNKVTLYENTSSGSNGTQPPPTNNPTPTPSSNNNNYKELPGTYVPDGDVNKNGIVNIQDYQIITKNFSTFNIYTFGRMVANYKEKVQNNDQQQNQNDNSSTSPTPTATPTPNTNQQNTTPGENQIINGDFSNGSSSWQTYSDGKMSLDTSENSAKITIQNPGSNVQLYQHDLLLSPNTTYNLELKAKASRNISFQLRIHKHKEPYDNYYNQDHRLTTQWQTISVNFTTPASLDNNTRLQLQFRSNDKEGDEYYFDDVVLKSVNELPESTNYIKNGDFSNNNSSWQTFSDAKMSFNTESGVGEVSIQDQGSNVQLYQQNIVLKPSTSYTIELKAKANRNIPIQLRVHKHQSPYNNYLQTDIELTSDWQTFSKTFTTANEMDGNTRLQLQFRANDKAGDQYFFDDVVLRRN